jgi:predicted Rdx family selenoprotein
VLSNQQKQKKQVNKSREGGVTESKKSVKTITYLREPSIDFYHNDKRSRREESLDKQ